MCPCFIWCLEISWYGYPLGLCSILEAQSGPEGDSQHSSLFSLTMIKAEFLL